MFIHHIGTQHHYVMSTSIGGVVRAFDSLNLRIVDQLERQIEAIYQPRQAGAQRREVHYQTVRHKQRGSRDCGVYSIAYAVEVAMGTDPAELTNISFDQPKMRDHLEAIFDAARISRFPRAPETRRGSRRGGGQT